MDPIETTFRVRYAETDAMGVVHHSSYILWFEEGRSHFMRQIGMPYSQVEQLGYYFTVSEVYARYVNPARYDEEVTIQTWLQDLQSRSLTFTYRVLRADNQQPLAEGYSRHICIAREGHVRRIPRDLRELLLPYLAPDAAVTPT